MAERLRLGAAKRALRTVSCYLPEELLLPACSFSLLWVDIWTLGN